MTTNSDNYYLSKEEPNQGCLLVLRKLIMDFDSNISESIKWGIPCFSYKNRMFAFLSIDKKTTEPYILVVEGNRIDHHKLEQGKRAKMKVFHVDPNQDIDIDALNTVFKMALELYKNGTIKTKN